MPTLPCRYALYESAFPDEVEVPVQWTAPEVIESMRFTTSSDIWAFAMMMVEVYTDGEKPFPGLTNIAVIVRVSGGAQPPRPRLCPDPLYKVLQKCWNLDSKQRPPFDSISRSLRKQAVRAKIAVADGADADV